MALLTRAVLAAVLLGAPWAGRCGAPDEFTLRAAAVYKLMLFVEWPRDTIAGTETVLCLVTEDHEASRAFAALAGKTIKGRSLQVERRQPLSHLRACHAVYFDRVEPGLLADKLAGLGGRPVLTFVSSAGAGSAAMIDLVLDSQRLAFDVRLASLKAAGLVLDAGVMQLAREVYK